MRPHDTALAAAVQTDRLARATARSLPADAGALERFLIASDRPAGSWESFVERVSARVRAIARAHRLSPHDVNDVVQAAWLRLLEHGEQIREPAAVEGWLHTTARRESLRILRQGARARPTDPSALGDPAAPDPPDDELDHEQRGAALRTAVAGLPRRQRELMALLMADPAPSYADIARAMDMPIGSIGPTRQRCLERLRRDPAVARLADGK